MKQLTNITAITIFASLISISCTQTNDEHKMDNVENHQNMTMDSSKSGQMDMDSGKTGKEAWVRKGEIDLQAIDKNKDGKVYQDKMDWNVISDEPGNCPICEMKLKEVTLEKAKENLVNHNFKVK